MSEHQKRKAAGQTEPQGRFDANGIAFPNYRDMSGITAGGTFRPRFDHRGKVVPRVNERKRAIAIAKGVAL